MHSAIAAFTLGVPSVLLCWNEKTVKLMNIVGYPDRVVTTEKLTPDNVITAFEKAMSEGIDPAFVDEMRRKALQSVEEYADILLSAAGY